MAKVKVLHHNGKVDLPSLTALGFDGGIHEVGSDGCVDVPEDVALYLTTEARRSYAFPETAAPPAPASPAAVEPPQASQTAETAPETPPAEIEAPATAQEVQEASTDGGGKRKKAGR